jgi:hypothetical protein
LFGQADGQILWQPRIGCWYDDRKFFGKPLPLPYTGLSLFDLYRRLGCSARLYEYNACFERVEEPRVRLLKRDLGNGNVEHMIKTPVGTQCEVWHHSPNNLHPVRKKFEVESRDELRIAIWREENATWRWNQQVFDRLQREVGDLGAPVMFMPRSNVQSLYLEKMGIERGVYAIYDWPELVEAYFRVLEESHDRLIAIINASPIDIINLGENIHSGTLSPALFRRYHLPACQRRCEKLHAADKFVYSHWDGNCKSLLPFARETGLDGIEAITPKPQGDVTIEEVRAALGDEMFMIDGIPAIYFDPMYPVSVLRECAHRVIDLFAPKLVLGASDEIASTAEIERIPFVGRIVDEYNGSCRKTCAAEQKDSREVRTEEHRE